MGKKSIAVIGEGITEWFYFDSLRIAHRYPFKVAPDFPQHSDIPHMSKLVNDYVVCLVDMDRLLAHPAEMETYKHQKSKSDSCVMWVGCGRIYGGSTLVRGEGIRCFCSGG